MGLAIFGLLLTTLLLIALGVHARAATGPTSRGRGRRRVAWRVALAGLVAASSLLAVGSPAGPAAPPVRVELVRGVHLGGGGGFASRPRPSLLGRRSPTTRGRGILRRIGHALAFAAVLHFLFAGSHGIGFLFLLLIAVGLVVLVTRGRRRRAYYRSPPRW